jgi:DNA repair exonuclease SbcCD ATPase subunit
LTPLARDARLGNEYYSLHLKSQDRFPAVTSQKIVEELQQVEQKLDTLRARAEEEQSTISELEGQVRELSGKLALTRRDVADFEGLLAEKRTELAEAEYDDAFQAREEAAARLAEAISQVLAELDVYDRAQQAVAALQGGPDTRDAQAEPEILAETWEQLVDTVRERINEQFEDELVEAASRSVKPGAIDELPVHLREAARERTRARLHHPR